MYLARKYVICSAASNASPAYRFTFGVAPTAANWFPNASYV
jgi:hypothetical protein